MKDNEVKETLSRLQLSHFDKINLWLVLKNLKKATTLEVNEDEAPIQLFLEASYLHYKVLKKETTIVYCISKQEKYAKEVYFSLKNFDFNDFNAHKKLGNLFSFPKAAVTAFCNNLEEIKSQNFKNLVGSLEFHTSFNYYWEPYTMYFVRRKYKYKDSLQAKKWADEIREELPDLAKAYEEDIKKAKFR